MTIMKSHASKLSAAIASICLLSGPAWATVTDTEGLNIGDSNTLDFDENSVAIGDHVTATGLGSAAFGDYTIASGENSAAFGYKSEATGNLSVAFNETSKATGSGSAAFNAATEASGMNSAAFGYDSTASGMGSVAFGYDTIASGTYSAAFGYGTTASGKYGISFGEYAQAQAYASMAIGRYNVVSGDTTHWKGEEPLFVIGNGTDAANPNNALTVLKDGRMGINTASPQVELDVRGSVALGYDANDTVQFGGVGTPFNAMQVGQSDIGTSTTQTKQVTITFPNAFNSAPVVMGNIVKDNTSMSSFSVTIQGVTNTEFVATIRRIGNSSSWTYPLKLNWQAYEL
uniref:Head domain of trimeric autotransporter adhesin n=1 Tax=Candidatus Kentrum sp. FW TaxID=2126338 RepID=A0A450SE90_9GAMM|nr:MAG: Head domain of trimeric autotransporter adhesin [Candidatus Kentron sp. FW]